LYIYGLTNLDIDCQNMMTAVTIKQTITGNA